MLFITLLVKNLKSDGLSNQPPLQVHRTEHNTWNLFFFPKEFYVFFWIKVALYAQLCAENNCY